MPRYHFWGENIRVNLCDDKVWFPDLNYRLFKRNAFVRFRSNDVNGLHNFLTYNGKRIVGGFNKSGVISLMVKAYTCWLKLRYGISLAVDSSTCIFHFHYFDLSAKKENDLRRKEFGYDVEMVSSAEEGLRYRLSDGIIPCINASKINLAEEVKQKYIHDISLYSNS